MISVAASLGLMVGFDGGVIHGKAGAICPANLFTSPFTGRRLA
jgi:hypothetical protein